MNPTDAIKHAPRWAWYTAGGVAVGAGALHFWKNRTTADGTTPLAPSTTDPVTMGGDPTMAGVGASSPIYIPSIATSQNDTGDPNSGSAAGLQTTSGIIDSAGGLISSISGIYQPVIDTNSTLTGLASDAIAALANAGSPPAPVVQNPTPLPATVPVAVTPKPTPVASNPCSGEYSHYDSGGKDCYKIVCSNGKKTLDGTPTTLAKGTWHIHKNGAKVHMSSTACM